MQGKIGLMGMHYSVQSDTFPEGILAERGPG